MIGGQKVEHLSRKTIDIVRIVGVAYAVSYVVYGLMVSLNFIEGPREFPLVAALLLGSTWIVAAWWQYNKSDISPLNNMEQIGLYALLSGVYTYWAIGLDSAFVVLWALLIALAGLQFGWRGFTAATGILIVFGSIMLATDEATNPQLVESTIAVIVTVFVSYAITLTLRQAVRDQKELDDSHAQAALQRDRTETLINHLSDAVISTNHNGAITLYNSATLSLLDTNIAIVGKSIDDVLRLSDVNGNTFSLTDALLNSRKATIRDDLLTISTGESTRLEITFAPIRRTYSGDTNEGGGYIVILRDVTTAKSLEEERDEFISVVSHELRTPIAIAEGTVSNAQLMLDRDDIPLEKSIAAVDMAHDQIVFLSRMVNDLSTLSRAERGVADDPELIDINEMINDLYSEYQPEARNKGLGFDLKLPAKVGKVNVSRLYLKELMQNFVTNAIKYTSSGSITIIVTPDNAKDRVELGVRDTGVGISKADQKRIFEKFYRAEDYRTRESSGTGLGLYVATKLARKLRTHIKVDSRLNHGSMFSIVLPLETDDKSDKNTAKA